MIKELALKADALSKSFNTDHVLKNVCLSIEKGNSVAITGRSGSGKSTLLHILATLEVPCSGSITICGKAVTKDNCTLFRSKHIGFVFQSFHLLDDFSLIDNVLMPAKIARKNTNEGSDIYLRAERLLDKVGLSHKKHSMTKVLSGGEKQRACLARALCLSPDILFADEPTGNLDNYHASVISELLFNLVKEEKTTLILVTHDLDLASLCNKTFHLKDGFLHPK